MTDAQELELMAKAAFDSVSRAMNSIAPVMQEFCRKVEATAIELRRLILFKTLLRYRVPIRAANWIVQRWPVRWLPKLSKEALQ